MPNIGRYLLRLFFLCVLAAFSSEAFAVMSGLSTIELTNSSDLIVIGNVNSVESTWSENGNIIVSRAKIVVESVITGKWEKEIINVEYLGGEVGDIGLRVSDVKPLKQGEKLLLFLKGKDGQKQKLGKGVAPLANEDIYHSIVGKAQGQYTITPQGIAKKDGFAILQGGELIDNDIPLGVLIDKIRGVKK